MLSETSSFLRICRTAIDAIRGTSDFLQKGEIEKALLEMRREYIELLDAHQAAKDSISKLKDEINEFHKQDENLQRYEPFPCPTGAIVYRLKKAHAAGAPPHYICTTCVEEKKRSFLQPSDDDRFLVCHNCGNKVKIQHDRPLVDPMVRVVKRDRSDGLW